MAELSNKGKFNIAAQLPMDSKDDIIVRLEKAGLAGKEVIKILRGLPKIIEDNQLTAVNVRLAVDVLAEKPMVTGLRLEAGNFCDEVMDLNVNSVPFSCKVANFLTDAGIQTVGQLCKLTPDSIMKHRNIGTAAVREIQDRLIELGLSLELQDLPITRCGTGHDNASE